MSLKTLMAALMFIFDYFLPLSPWFVINDLKWSPSHCTAISNTRLWINSYLLRVEFKYFSWAQSIGFSPLNRSSLRSIFPSSLRFRYPRFGDKYGEILTIIFHFPISWICHPVYPLLYFPICVSRAFVNRPDCASRFNAYLTVTHTMTYTFPDQLRSTTWRAAHKMYVFPILPPKCFCPGLVILSDLPVPAGWTNFCAPSFFAIKVQGELYFVRIHRAIRRSTVFFSLRSLSLGLHLIESLTVFSVRNSIHAKDPNLDGSAYAHTIARLDQTDYRLTITLKCRMSRWLDGWFMVYLTWVGAGSPGSPQIKNIMCTWLDSSSERQLLTYLRNSFPVAPTHR